MTAAQVLTRELVGLLQTLEPRLGDGAIVGDAVRAEVERAGRTLQAIAALVGVAPRVEITAADLRPKAAVDRCPRCNEKLRLVPSCGFGSTAKDICGACGYEPAAA